MNLVGDRYGRLTVVSLHSSGKGFRSWNCVCDCGENKIVQSGILRSGNTRSCGCLRSESVKATDNKNSLAKGEASLNALYRVYQNKANLRGIEFDLTKDVFRHLTSQPCQYCGALPKRVHRTATSRTTGGYTYNGIDRIDSRKGYVSGNCNPCCTTCNRAKSDMPLPDFLDWMARIARFWEGHHRRCTVISKCPQCGAESDVHCASGDHDG